MSKANQLTSSKIQYRNDSLRRLRRLLQSPLELRFTSGPISWRIALMPRLSTRSGWSQADILELVNTIRVILKKYEGLTLGRNKFTFVLTVDSVRCRDAVFVIDWENKEIRLNLNQPPAEVLARAPYKICRELIKNSKSPDEDPQIMVTGSPDLHKLLFQLVQQGSDAIVRHYAEKRAIPLSRNTIKTIILSIMKVIQDSIAREKIIHGLLSPYLASNKAVLEWVREESRRIVSITTAREYDGENHAWESIAYLAFLSVTARKAGHPKFEKECLDHLNGNFGTDLMYIENARLAREVARDDFLFSSIRTQPAPARDGFHIIFVVCMGILSLIFNKMQIKM